jgi:hypothetical protein
MTMQVYHGEIHCPKCKLEIDMGTGLAGVGKNHAPQRGDVTVCAHCLELLIFADRAHVLVLEGEALANLAPRIVSALHGAREMLADKGVAELGDKAPRGDA